LTNREKDDIIKSSNEREVINMTDNIYWVIECENYQGHDETYYFTSHEVAIKNFLTIVEKYKDMYEFEQDGNSCMWFDSSFNEYSTYIYLMRKPLPAIHDDIIF
jgi:single-stranded DNA-specific DHH superfamily exonuclease